MSIQLLHAQIEEITRRKRQHENRSHIEAALAVSAQHELNNANAKLQLARRQRTRELINNNPQHIHV